MESQRVRHDWAIELNWMQGWKGAWSLWWEGARCTKSRLDKASQDCEGRKRLLVRNSGGLSGPSWGWYGEITAHDWWGWKGPSFTSHPWDQGVCLTGHQESPAPHLFWGIRCTGVKSLFLQAKLPMCRFDTECFIPTLALWEPETFKLLPFPMVQTHLWVPPDWGNRWLQLLLLLLSRFSRVRLCVTP